MGVFYESTRCHTFVTWLHIYSGILNSNRLPYLEVNVDRIFHWLLDFRSLLDDGLEVRNSESPERAASVFAFLSVGVSVNKLQVTVFDPATNFLKTCSLGLWEKRFFSVFRNFDIFRNFFHFFFRVLSSLSLYWPQDIRSTYKHFLGCWL